MCNSLGTNKTAGACDRVTGQCPCLPNVVGIACDLCAAHHFDLASGKCICLNTFIVCYNSFCLLISLSIIALKVYQLNEFAHQVMVSNEMSTINPFNHQEKGVNHVNAIRQVLFLVTMVYLNCSVMNWMGGVIASQEEVDVHGK